MHKAVLVALRLQIGSEHSDVKKALLPPPTKYRCAIPLQVLMWPRETAKREFSERHPRLQETQKHDAPLVLQRRIKKTRKRFKRADLCAAGAAIKLNQRVTSLARGWQEFSLQRKCQTMSSRLFMTWDRKDFRISLWGRRKASCV
jgi:hypothetical protein